MNKIIFSLAAVLILLTGCDGVNSDIDDLPRTLRISARTITDTETGWELTEEGFQNVSSANGAYSGAIGNVAITTPLDSYVRSSVVSATASSNDVDYVFAYWLLPSRTDSVSDSNSTEGNIRFTDGSGSALDSISLRTDHAVSEIVGAYGKDGNTASTFESTIPTPILVGDNGVDFSFILDPVDLVIPITVTDPKYRIFDESGEALTSWQDFVVESGDLVISDVDGTALTQSLIGIEDRSNIDSWKVVILYKDAAGDVYVVK